ncbi:MAG TPA: hypothetical protein VK504_25275 [Vicinamibacterales bacterium]|jgi:hypothetical protein|nr:hypothetical protein [Vicinamibacterales bacterium]
MAGENNAAPPSLRDIAEQAYDDLETNAEADIPAEGPGPETEGAVEETLATDERPRDKSGRWVSKSEGPQPGEAIEPLDPAPKKPIQATPERPTADPATAPPAVKSNQVPEHWSAEDKATFAKLPQEGQAFLLKRHGDMEAEFTRKSQASAGAVQFTNALAPVFRDPQIAKSLQAAGVNPVQAIHEWANWHRMGSSENQEDKFKLLVDLTQRMGLDPARIFSAFTNPPPNSTGLSEEDLKDPAVKFIADHLGKTQSKLVALEGQLQQREQREQQAREQMQVQHAKQGVDGFADEKGKDGQPLRPYFNTVLPLILDMFKANPERNLADTYDAACWAHPEVRKHMLAAERHREQSQHDVARARLAQRGNTRGLTAPVARPDQANGASKGGMRDAIERSADEVGF